MTSKRKVASSAFPSAGTELGVGGTKLYRLACENLQQGDLRTALERCRRLNKEFPHFGAGWYTASVTFARLGNWQRALELLERALELQPEHCQYLVHKANCLANLRRPTESLALARALAVRYPDDAGACAGIGTAFTACSEHASAAEAYRMAAVRDPNNPLYHFNLASTLRFLGDLAAAERSYDAGLRLNPHDYEAYLIRADLRTQSAQRNHISEIEQRLRAGVSSWRGEVQLCYALAKEYEDLGAYTQAFQSLKRGANLKRAHIEYRVESELETIDKIISVFDEARFSQERGADCKSAEPIFIVGMPRTGTTLAERILGCHSQVHPLGELNNFAAEMMKIAQPRSDVVGARSQLDLVAESSRINFQSLGENYIASTRPRSGRTRHFTDKLPFNYLYIGLIALALPNAKIVRLVRNPMDTCYAVYKTLFKHAYPFSYDLSDLGRYYVAYRKLMDHWDNVLPGKLYSLHYESLIENQEIETRRLLEFCGLTWEDACLHFEANSTPAVTASAAQVRQPLYRTSIGRWRCYTKELEPLASILRRSDIAIC